MARVVSARDIRRSSGASASAIPSRVRPLWTVNLQGEDEIIKWLTETVQELESDHNALVQSQDKKREFYAGMQAQSLGRVGIPRDRDEVVNSNTFSRVTINKLYNMMELWVAKLTRYSPNVVVNPANNEYSDRVSAKLGKIIADNLAYVNDMETVLEECVRKSRIDGEVFAFPDWDKDVGDYVQGFQDTLDDAQPVAVIDSEGNPVYGSDEEPLYTTPQQKIGDVRVNIVDSRFVILEPKLVYKDVDWCIRMRVRYADEVRTEFPDIGEIEEGTFGPFNFPWLSLAENEVLEWQIYHKATKNCAPGIEIRMLHDKVLSVGPYQRKSARDMLPMVRYTCIDIPGVLRGVSILDNLMIQQVLLNNVVSMAYTNASLGAHIFWLVPTGANADLSKLRNGASVIKFTGAQAPKIESFKTVGEELFRLFEYLEKWILEGSGHQGISQGDPPPGVDAAIAMGVLEEQENQRANPEIKKYNAFVKKLYVLMLSLAQDNYKNSDGRLLRIVGKNSQDTLKAIDMSKFSGSYDVRVQRSTTLSESKSLRLQQLMLIHQNWPNAVSDQRFLDIMEMGDEEKFFDIVTASTHAAEAENEKFFGGEPVLPPNEFEDHLAHWQVHVPFMNTLSFKEDVDPELQKLMVNHVLTHEFFLFQKASNNMALLQKLITQELYPLFFKLPIPLVQVAQFIQQGISVDQALQMKQQQELGGLPAPGGAPPDAAPQEGAPPPSPEAPPEAPDGQLEGAEAPPLEAQAAAPPQEAKPATDQLSVIAELLKAGQSGHNQPIHVHVDASKHGSQAFQLTRGPDGSARIEPVGAD